MCFGLIGGMVLFSSDSSVIWPIQLSASGTVPGLPIVQKAFLQAAIWWNCEFNCDVWNILCWVWYVMWAYFSRKIVLSLSVQYIFCMKYLSEKWNPKTQRAFSDRKWIHFSHNWLFLFFPPDLCLFFVCWYFLFSGWYFFLCLVSSICSFVLCPLLCLCLVFACWFKPMTLVFCV